MTKHVNYQLAKLLKDKGFDIPCRYLRVGNEYIPRNVKEGELYDNGVPSLQIPTHWYLAPTIAEVVMWVYEKHKIWINVNTLFDHEVYSKKDKWEYDITNLYNAAHYDTDLDFNSPTEAYEAAIEYCLTNII